MKKVLVILVALAALLLVFGCLTPIDDSDTGSGTTDTTTGTTTTTTTGTTTTTTTSTSSQRTLLTACEIITPQDFQNLTGQPLVETTKDLVDELKASGADTGLFDFVNWEERTSYDWTQCSFSSTDETALPSDVRLGVAIFYFNEGPQGAISAFENDLESYSKVGEINEISDSIGDRRAIYVSEFSDEPELFLVSGSYRIIVTRSPKATTQELADLANLVISKI